MVTRVFYQDGGYQNIGTEEVDKAPTAQVLSAPTGWHFTTLSHISSYDPSPLSSISNYPYLIFLFLAFWSSWSS